MVVERRVIAFLEMNKSIHVNAIFEKGLEHILIVTYKKRSLINMLEACLLSCSGMQDAIIHIFSSLRRLLLCYYRIVRE